MPKVNLFDFVASLESTSAAEDKTVAVSTQPEKVEQTEEPGAVVADKAVTTEAGQKTPVVEAPAADGTAVAVDDKSVKVEETVDGQDQPKNADANADAVSVATEDNMETIEGGEAETYQPQTASGMLTDVEDAMGQLDGEGITSVVDSRQSGVDEIIKDSDNIETVQAALEGYHQLLSTLHFNGGKVTPDLAQSIKIGLESFDAEFFADTVPALESFGHPVASLEASDSLMANVGEKLKKVGAAAKEAIKRLIDMLVDLWQAMSRDTGKLTARLEAIKKDTKDYEGGKKLTLGSAERLSINGLFVGDSDAAMKDVATTAEELLVKWPAALRKILETYTEQQVSFLRGGEGQLNKLMGAMEDNFTTVFRSFGKGKSVAPENLKKWPKVASSPTLPGNKAVFFAVRDTAEYPNHPSTERMYSLMHSTKTITVEFAQVGNAKRFEGEFQLKSPDASTIHDMANGLEKIISKVLESDEARSEMKKIQASTRRLTWTDATDGSMKGNAPQIVLSVMAQNILKHSLVANHGFTGYLISLIKTYIVTMEAFLKADRPVAEAA